MTGLVPFVLLSICPSTLIMASMKQYVRRRQVHQQQKRNLYYSSKYYNKSTNAPTNSPTSSPTSAATSASTPSSSSAQSYQANDDYASTSANKKYNYLWQRDDDDDYYDSSSSYWNQNKNLKAGYYNGNDDKQTGGAYVQRDDDSQRYKGYSFDSSSGKKRGYFSQNDDEYGEDTRVGMGLLSRAQRVIMAAAIACAMICVALVLLFSPLILSSIAHCCCGSSEPDDYRRHDVSAPPVHDKDDKERIRAKRRKSRSRSRSRKTIPRSASRNKDLTKALAARGGDLV